MSAKALRYYESVGLIEPAGRTPAGYRTYDDTVLERLAFIRSAQALGLTLGEIRGVTTLRDTGIVPCAHVVELLRERAEDVDRTIRELRELQGELRRLVDGAALLDPAACSPERVCHVIG